MKLRRRRRSESTKGVDFLPHYYYQHLVFVALFSAKGNSTRNPCDISPVHGDGECEM